MVSFINEFFLRSWLRISIVVAHFDRGCAFRSWLRISIVVAHFDRGCAFRSWLRISIVVAHSIKLHTVMKPSDACFEQKQKSRKNICNDGYVCLWL